LHKKNNIIPAIDRGIKVLDFLIRNSGKAKYSEIKKIFSEITDASFNRLLLALIDSNCIKKNEFGYEISDLIKSWQSQLSGSRT